MPPRTRLSLDGQWNFWTDTDSSYSLSSLDMQTAAQVSVPAPWQADARFRDHTGAAWYQRKFDIPGAWPEQGRVIILGFGAVDYFAEVWLNDTKVGEHEGGYLPFELDVTEVAHPGMNTLTIRVNDPLEIFPEIPHGKQSWYGMLSGIWQSVWMESRAATHIQRVKISTNGEQASVDVNVHGALTDGLTAEVFAPNGEVAARVESRAPSFTLHIPQPAAWSPDEPNLYKLRVCIRDDEVVEIFGFRTIEARTGQILLNGIPFYMRAALDQDYYPDLICTPPSQEYIEDEFRKAKEMGLNCLRVHIKVADPRYYAAADKLGLLIWTELPNHILLSEDAKRRAKETLAGMVERDWNHPSIGIWTIINESWGIDLTHPAQRAWLAETYDWLKELDPTRLVVGNSACWGNYHVATDIADFHIYYAMPDHHDQWQEWMAIYAGRPGWRFAHEYQGHAAWREFALNPWHPIERPRALEVREHGEEPLLVSEFGNWGLPDVEKLYAGNGGEEPWWFSTGLEWGDGVVYPRGVEQRFKNYHLNLIFPSLAALTEASQRLQYDALKYQIEQIRRYESVQGYVITELTDVHWESNGLLDTYRNPKVHHDLLKKVNADDVLIPLWERLAFSSGETARMTVLCSHYSVGEIKDATLEWRVCHDQISVGEGQVMGIHCTPFGVTELGAVNFKTPAVEKPTLAQLELRLVSDGNRVASTTQEFYIFPDPQFQKLALTGRIFAPELRSTLQQSGCVLTENLSEADVAIVTTLDDPLREYLLHGGRVLFLAEDCDALQTYIPGIKLKERDQTAWQGDWASSFGWHRFKALPTKGVIDFAFAGLTPEHVIKGFAPRDFASDVYAGLFVGWIHKPVATIARKRVGQGTLLISTFRLTKNLEINPLAAHLFRELTALLAA